MGTDKHLVGIAKQWPWIEAAPGWLRLRWYWVIQHKLVLVMAFTGLTYALAFAPGFSGYDDAVYIVLAKSIVSGQGLSWINVVGTPPATLVPFGFPLLLSPIVYLLPNFPANLPALVLISTVFGVLLAGSVYLFLEGTLDLDPRLAAFLALLTTLNYLWMQHVTRTVHSESSYLFFSLLSLLLVGRYERERTRVGSLYLAVGAMAISYFIRTVGITLIAACAVYLLLKREYRRALVVCLLFALLIFPWVYRNISVGASPFTQDYGNLFWLKDWWHPEQGIIGGPGDLVLRVFRNVWGHISQSAPWLFFPSLGMGGARLLTWLQALGLDWVPAFVGFAVTIAMAIGFVTQLKRGPSLLDLYLIFYGGMILLAPWFTFRNLFPVLPFLLYYLLLGLRAAGRQLGRMAWVPAYASRGAVVFILSLVLISNVISDRHNLSAGAAYRAQGLVLGEEHEAIAEAAFWLRQNTPEDTLVLSSPTEEMYLWSERKVSPAFASLTSLLYQGRDQAQLLSDVREYIDYVVVRASGDGFSWLFDAEAAQSIQLSPVFETSANPKLIIYRVVREDDK